MARSSTTMVKGTELWKLIKNKSTGRKRKYPDADTLWAAALAYFEWVDDNPVVEDRLVQHKGKCITKSVNHPRPMTIQGLCAHLGISDETWNNYRTKNYQEECELVEQIMYEQKLSGASAGLMSANLMARYLGLTDHHKVDNKNYNFDLSGHSEEALKAIINGSD